MSLLDQLRDIEHFPVSHAPTVNEVLELVGKLAAYVEHGDELLEAADADRDAREAGEPATGVHELLSPSPEPDAEPPEQGPRRPTPEPDWRDQEIAELKQQLQNLIAAGQRTQAAPPDAQKRSSWSAADEEHHLEDLKTRDEGDE